LKDALAAATPSLSAFARSAGISYDAIRQYSKGARTPSPRVIRAIAVALTQQTRTLAAAARDLATLADKVEAEERAQKK
jgi:transcriptional regulator with XRE-family HTH domain